VDPFDLPRELRDLERRLAARGRPEPSADLRPRVLAAVRRELAARPALTQWVWGGFWQYAAAAAAGLLLVLNLLMSMGNRSDFPVSRAANGADVQQAAAMICELVSFITPEEAAREALLLRAGSHLEMVPQPRPGVTGLRALRQIEEGPPWVTQ
jgi:hypothetical protein